MCMTLLNSSVYDVYYMNNRYPVFMCMTLNSSVSVVYVKYVVVYVKYVVYVNVSVCCVCHDAESHNDASIHVYDMTSIYVYDMKNCQLCVLASPYFCVVFRIHVYDMNNHHRVFMSMALLNSSVYDVYYMTSIHVYDMMPTLIMDDYSCVRHDEYSCA